MAITRRICEVVISLWFFVFSMLPAEAADMLTGSQISVELKRCRTIIDALDRVGCYDKLPLIPSTVYDGGSANQTMSQKSIAAAQDASVAKYRSALSAGGVMAPSNAASADNEQVTLFGIPIPFTEKDSLNASERLANEGMEKDANGLVEAIRVKVKEWTRGEDGRLVLILDNGQVWRQTDEVNALVGIGDGSISARISRGALGGFKMTLNDSKRVMRVRRVDWRQRSN